MHSIKKAGIILLFLLSILVIVLSSSYYFFSVNDYSDWISQQVKSATGYDLRFQRFENNWFEDNRLSFIGVSLYQQQQPIAVIKRLDIDVDSLDLWQRELVINSIKIDGVDIKLKTPLTLSESDVQTSPQQNSQTQQPTSKTENLDWEKLYISTIEITHLNADVQYEDNSLSLKQAHLNFNDLLVINHQQLQTIPATLDFSSAFEQLILKQDKQSAEISDFKLTASAGLAQREAKIAVTAAQVISHQQDLSPIALDSLQLSVELNNNKLLLQRFFVNAFSGSFEMTADALLAINWLPKPTVSVKKVQLLSLVAQDLQLNIPELPNVKDESQQAQTNAPQSFPVEAFFIKSVELKNIDLTSEAEQFPLQLKSADIEINDWHIIKDNQLLDPTQDSSQSGNVAIAFEYLSWQETIIEQFSMQGDLDKNNPDLNLLNALLMEK